MAEFDVTVRRNDDAVVVDLRGDLDGAATDAMQAAQGEVAAARPEVVVLNFADLGYMNSTGIALVVGVLADSRRSGTDVRVCGLSDHYRHIFEITRLADFVSFHADEDQAVGQPDTHAT